MNSFDYYVAHLMSDWAQHSVLLNKFIIRFLTVNTVKTLPLFTILWFLWFSDTKNRPAILEGFVAMFIAGGLSRVIQDLMPESVRPYHNDAFLPPLGIPNDPRVLEHWSSFPSDHAAVYFALSTALWLLSRRIGAVSFAWSILIICMPRVFAGYHYVSDVIAGAVIGVLVALLVAPSVANKIGSWVWAAEAKSKGLFYAVFFALSFEVLTMFDDVRIAASGLKKFM